jgi:3-isopropylmalate dehydrogenase
VLWGEGVGQEVIAAGLEVLESVVGPRSVALNVYEAGRLDGHAVKAKTDRPLTDEILGLCEQTFARGGAVIQGPYGGRFVYDLRKHFDLFFKISPLQSALSAEDASLLKPEVVKGLDILITRENCGGIYQGQWSEDGSVPGRRVARHHFDYEESQVRRFLRASARLAKQRRGKMAVVWKESGLPSISALWRTCAMEAAEEFGVDMQLVGIDLMAYWLLQRAATFDVIATPNLFGDVIADLGAILLGSRGASFSGNYSEDGKSVYQTNHGAGFDLEGSDKANPAGQIFAFSMMLRETFGRYDEADIMEEAVRSVWREGWRTEDVAIPGCRVVGTREMGRRIAGRAEEIMETRGARTAAKV